MSDRIKQIVRDLLRLATNAGATEGEKAAAKAKADELIAKYALEIEQDADTGETCLKGDWIAGDWTENWHVAVATAVGLLYGCRCVVGTGRANGRQSKKATGHFQFVGLPSDIEMAEDTMRSVFDQIEAEWKSTLSNIRQVPEWKQLDAETRKDLRCEIRDKFKDGAGFGIYGRVQEILQHMRPQLGHDTSKALTILDQKLADADAINDGKAIVRRSKKAGLGTALGVMAADRVELNKRTDAGGQEVEAPLQLPKQ